MPLRMSDWLRWGTPRPRTSHANKHVCDWPLYRHICSGGREWTTENDRSNASNYSISINQSVHQIWLCIRTEFCSINIKLVLIESAVIIHPNHKQKPHSFSDARRKQMRRTANRSIYMLNRAFNEYLCHQCLRLLLTLSIKSRFDSTILETGIYIMHIIYTHTFM